MSLILDALQQAEHERGRDRAPDLFGPALGATAPQHVHPPLSRLPWALAGMAMLVAVGALAWIFWPRPPTSVQVPQAALPPVASPQATGATQLSPPPAAPANAAPVPPASVAPPPLPTPATSTAPAPARSEPEPAPTPTTAAAAEAAAAAAAAAPSLPTPPATSVTAETPLPALTELPAEVRARLSGLNITGHTYSDNPTLRMLMIDGRMFVEGQAVQPGLRVERIGPHRAVFNHQGTHFAVDY